tara:strand:+ start:204 stop:539 length:336 start_codon:yes stop_codon:yes gene_type:complete
MAHYHTQGKDTVMQVKIAEDGTLALEDADNFKAFSIVEAVAGTAAGALGDRATAAEDNHYWLDAQAVIDLSGRGDDDAWCNGFWAMLKAVEKYGYSDLSAKRVKAHVEAPA